MAILEFTPFEADPNRHSHRPGRDSRRDLHRNPRGKESYGRYTVEPETEGQHGQCSPCLPAEAAREFLG